MECAGAGCFSRLEYFSGGVTLLAYEQSAHGADHRWRIGSTHRCLPCWARCYFLAKRWASRKSRRTLAIVSGSTVLVWRAVPGRHA
jgi:hypothetical protein